MTEWIGRLPLFLGGFLGPFGTMVILPMFPELRDEFGVSTEAVSWAFSAYLFPMAFLMLFSGTIGERYGRRRVVRATFIVYGLASVLAVIAPSFGWFLVARALQGMANAFITPLLVAGLAEVTAAAEVGMAVGVYSSFQSFGGAMAPFFGGLVAEVDWRWAFVGTAIVSGLLSLRPPPGEPRPGAAAPSIRVLFDRRMSLLGLAAFSAAMGPVGASVIVGLKARDELGLSSSAAGVALLGGGLGAMLMGPYWGRLLDRIGVRQASILGVSLSMASVLALGFADTALGLGLLFIVAGAVANLIVVILQSSAAVAVPDNRGGAVSGMLAFRFAGHSVGPLVFTAIFTQDPLMAFVGASALGVVTLGALLGFAATPATTATMAS